MRPRLFPMLLLVWPAACGPSTMRWLPIPDEGTRTLVLWTIDDEQGPRVRAYDLAESPTIEIDADAGGSMSFEAFTYRADPETLRLPLGPLSHEEGRWIRPLPEPGGAFFATVEEGETEGWVSTPTSTGQLASFRLADPCPGFEIESHPIRIEQLINIEQLDAQRALIVTLGTHLYTSTIRGVLRPLNVSGISPDEQLGAASVAEDGTVWLGGSRLWRGTLDGDVLQVTAVTSTVPGERVTHLAAGKDRSGADELFAMTLKGHLLWIRNGIIDVVHQFPPLSAFDNSSRSGLVRLGPEEALAVIETSGSAAHVSSGRVELEPVAEQGLSALGMSADGSVIAVGLGLVARRSPSGRWDPMEGSLLSLIPREVAPFADGFVFGGGDGYFSQYIEGRFCQAFQARGNAVEHIVPFGDTLIVTGDNSPETGMSNSIEILIQRPSS